MGTVGSPLDLQLDGGGDDEAVEDGHGQRWVAEVVGPGLEADVGHQGGGAFGATAVDDLVQKAGRLGGFGSLDAVEAEFVDGQEIEVGVVAQPLVEAVVGQRGGEVAEQVGAGGVADAISVDARDSAHRLNDPALADAALAGDDEVVAAADELAGGQGFDLAAVDRLGVEVPVEAFQRDGLAEAGLANAAFDGPLTAEVGLGSRAGAARNSSGLYRSFSACAKAASRSIAERGMRSVWK